MAAGSLSKRLGLPEGTRLAKTVLEFCYKDDALGDPMVNDYHIAAMGWASQAEMRTISDYSLKVNQVLGEYLSDLGIELIDFKLEFGRLPDGTIVLADEISPDTCRFWDTKTGEKLDKDRFRRDMGGVEGAYQEILRRLLGLTTSALPPLGNGTSSSQPPGFGGGLGCKHSVACRSLHMGMGLRPPPTSPARGWVASIALWCRSLYSRYAAVRSLAGFAVIEALVVVGLRPPAPALESTAFISLSGDVPKFVIETISFGAILLLAIVLLMRAESPSTIVSLLSIYALAGYKLLPTMQQVYKSIATMGAHGSVAFDLASELAMQSSLSKIDDAQSLDRVETIQLEGISYTYPGASSEALHEINLTFKRGELNTIAGHSGSGKSTLVDVILGLLNPQREGY